MLLLGVAGSGLGALAWSSYVRVQATRTFEISAGTAAEALTTSLQRDSDLTATARVLVETTPSLTNTRFASWFHLLQTHNSYPGSFGLMYIEKVGASQLQAFEDTTSQDPPFGIRSDSPFALTPAGSAAPYCLTRAGVVQLSPRLHLSTSALLPLISLASSDLDFCALPIGRLLSAAGRTAKPAATTLASLVASTPNLPGEKAIPRSLIRTFRRAGLLTTLTPVYARSGPTRASTLQGWILGVFQASSILGPILNAHRGFAAVLSYENPTGQHVVLDRTVAQGGTARTFNLAGPGPWSVSLSSTTDGSEQSPLVQGVGALLGGLLVTLLLFLLVRFLVRSRSQAITLAGERSAQLEHLALHDGLTGLPNRSLVFKRVEEAIARARSDATDVAVILVDLDHFTDVNERFGHAGGDAVIRQVADRFRTSLRAADTVGRLGGDEFVVVLDDRAGSGDAEEVATRLIESLRDPFPIDRGQRRVSDITASIGIARGVRETAEKLISDADIARYEAKATAKGRYLVFRPEMREAVTRRLSLEAELRRALAEGQFFVVFQPIVDLADLRPVGVEALVRWQHPVDGVVMPDAFIPTLEATGMILDVGRVVLEQACTQCATWRRGGHALYVSVNVSARQLDRGNFVDTVRSVLRSSRLDSSALRLEITETTLMRNAELSAARLSALKETGVKLAIDDFGTGYCSLAYLQQFPVDALKVDQSFITSMESPEGMSLVRTILRLGRDLRLETVAEGIETHEQLRRLRAERCESGQGYLFARPVPASDVLRILERQGPSTVDTTVTEPVQG